MEVTELQAHVEEIVAMGWPTQRLVGFALVFHDRNNPRKECWQYVSSTQEEARDFFAGMAEQDPDYLRELAAEALAAGGWTPHTINFRMS